MLSIIGRIHRVMHRAAAILAVVGLSAPLALQAAERIKDLASLQGVRNNQLVGYGLVVGLDGSGDQTTQAPFTSQSVINMLAQLGTTVNSVQGLQLKNVAAVMVTANLPPFARIGQQIDVTVSSMGNAKSLRGGTLVMTPLKGADGQIYAQAQGNLLVGGVGAASGGSKVVVNHLLAGRIVSGATVEREVPTALGQGPFVLSVERQGFRKTGKMLRTGTAQEEKRPPLLHYFGVVVLSGRSFQHRNGGSRKLRAGGGQQGVARVLCGEELLAVRGKTAHERQHRLRLIRRRSFPNEAIPDFQSLHELPVALELQC